MSPTHYCTECGALWRQCDDGSWNLRSDKAGPCCDNAAMGEQIKPLAAPSAQAEPARQLHSFSSIDCEKLIAATVPGGSACDPQEVADNIRRYLDAWPSAQAEPQVPQDIAVIRAACRAEALQEAAQCCDRIERKKWETLRDGGKLEGIGPRDCATAIREMK